MLCQQQQQQPLPALPTMEDLLHFMAQQSKAIYTLQQQLIAQNTPKPKVTASPKFDGLKEAVVGFVNACCLYTKCYAPGLTPDLQ